jgi:hypothetical protein
MSLVTATFLVVVQLSRLRVHLVFSLKIGRAFSRSASVLARVRSCGICGGPSGAGKGVFRLFQFLLPNIPPTASHSSSSTIRGWYSGPNRDRRAKYTQSHSTRRNLKNAPNYLCKHDEHGNFWGLSATPSWVQTLCIIIYFILKYYIFTAPISQGRRCSIVFTRVHMRQTTLLSAYSIQLCQKWTALNACLVC